MAIPQPDSQARTALEAQLAPYGRLTEAAQWLAACQGSAPAQEPQRIRAIVFAEQEPHLPAPETAARRAGAGLNVATVTDLSQAYGLGAATADAEIDAGADLLIPGGVESARVPAVVMATMTQTEPVVIVGKQPSVEDWKREVSAIRDAMFRARNLEGMELVASCQSAVLAAAVGLITRAAERRTPLLIDAPLTATAALLAERDNPGVKEWLFATTLSTAPAHELALRKLGLQPLHRLAMEPEPTLGALAALPMLLTGVEIAADV